MDSSLPPTPRSSMSVSSANTSGLAPPSFQSSPSPTPSTDVSSSADATRDDPDPTIVEALSGSKDRLFVLKLGDDFDNILNDRGNTPAKRYTYAPPSSYQRMLVHRCAQYYKLAIESDGKAISVMLGPESRAPKTRISEIVPMEQTPAPAFKIMRRTADERARAKQPGRADSTGDDQPDPTALTEEPKRRPQMTIEERTAAYEQARSRIFQGFQEKDDQPSPPTRRDSGNSDLRWVDKQRRPDFTSSSRGSPIPQDMAIPASYYPPMLFNPNAPSALVHPPPPQPYDPNVNQPAPYMYPQYYPMYAYYPQPPYDPRQGPVPVPAMQMGYPPPQGVPYPFPPQHAATWPIPIQPHPQPQPQPQHSPEIQRHAFPQMAHPPPQPNRQHMHMPPQVQTDPFPPNPYMQSYPYAGFVHQPVLVPTPPDAPGSGHSSRSGSRNGHGNGHASNGSNGGAKGPRSAVGTWGASTVATPMRNVTGVNRRLSTSSSSTSAYSSSGGGAGSGSRTPADETASIASSASSSSSRRTYTSTSTTSKHPLPPRPDWAVGLMADSSLSRTTSSSSTDSRLRMTSRSSSGNQIPRAGTAGSVKLGTPANANATDFPPLNGNGNGNGAVNNGVRTGAWGREGSPATLFGNNMNAPPPPANRRFEETDSIGRPVPKSFGLYNPNTGAGPAALPAQVRTPQEDALADQVSKMSVTDNEK